MSLALIYGSFGLTSLVAPTLGRLPPIHLFRRLAVPEHDGCRSCWKRAISFILIGVEGTRSSDGLDPSGRVSGSRCEEKICERRSLSERTRGI